MHDLVLVFEIGARLTSDEAALAHALALALAEAGMPAAFALSFDAAEALPPDLADAMAQHAIVPTARDLAALTRRVPRPWQAHVVTLQEALAGPQALCGQLGGGAAAARAFLLGGAVLNPALLVAAASLDMPICLGAPYAGSGPGEALQMAAGLLVAGHSPVPDLLGLLDGVATAERPATEGEGGSPDSGDAPGPSPMAGEWARLAADLTAPAPGVGVLELHLGVVATGVAYPGESPETAAARLVTLLRASPVRWLPVSALGERLRAPTALDGEQVLALARQITPRLHHVMVAEQWLAPTAILSVLTQAGAALHGSDHLPASISPEPWLGPPASFPTDAVLVPRRDLFAACATVRAAVATTGCVPAFVHLGPWVVGPSSFTVALARALVHAEPWCKVPAGPLPVFDSTRKAVRQYADTLAADTPDPDGHRLRVAILEQGWTAAPAIHSVSSSPA